MPDAARRWGEKRHRLAQLRTFCTVARLGSMTQAAARLGLSEPGVSIQIRDLELELQAELFDRLIGRGTEVTAAGRQLLALCEPLVQGIDALPAWLEEPAGEETTEHTEVAATALAAIWVLPRHVASLRTAHPSATVRVRTCTVGEGLDLLGAREVELLIGEEDAQHSARFDFRPIVTRAPVLVAGLEHPLASGTAQYARETGRWHAVGPISDATARALRVAVETVVECDDLEAVKRYAEVGLGVAAIPRIAIAGHESLAIVSQGEAGAGERGDAQRLGAFTERARALGPHAAQLLREMTRAARCQGTQPKAGPRIAKGRGAQAGRSARRA